MATCSVLVSSLFKINYYHLRHNKAKYQVLSKTYGSPAFHWVSSLTFFCKFFPMQLQMVIFDFEEERDWGRACEELVDKII